jgi:two-component system, LuxR family, sensor kinase FixL
LCVGQDITSLKLAQERTLQSERLAAIGQMMTGLAHESGNALARSQACLEMLALEVQDRPEAFDLVGRIQKAQNHLQQLYEEVRSYAAPLRLEREQWAVDTVWRQAWTNLAMRRQGRQTELREETQGVDLKCSIDPFRLEQVFRNMMENSLAACRDPVEITIRAKPSGLDGQPALRISVQDNGPGFSAEQKRRIFEPFYTTKTKGTGLGMAIATRIIEAHGGKIAVGNAASPGAEIVITLPRESP